MLLDEADSKDPAAIAQREFDIQWTANSLYVGKPRTALCPPSAPSRHSRFTLPLPLPLLLSDTLQPALTP